MIRTKIIATVGPASRSTDTLIRLIKAGVDVFRLNFSHGTIADHGTALQAIRSAAAECQAVVAVLGDLCGPKIRVDPVQHDSFDLPTGAKIRIVAEPVLGNAERVSTSRPQLVHEASVGHRILIDDGMIRLRVEKAENQSLLCQCEAGGTVRSRKGVNLPDTDLQMSSMTEKDRADLAWALAHDVDYIALSFVRRAEDLEELRAAMRACGRLAPIVAKIETPQAINDLQRIIETTDVVLVARGDLGVEMDLACVPLLQKDITARSQRAGKPVIVATQMLQSMVEHPSATRAEVSDVANAVFDLADAVMLSAETAVGAYPVAAVEMMNRIAQETETYLARNGFFARIDADDSLNPIATGVVRGATTLARELRARLIAAWTRTGNTVRLLSKCRPDRLIVGLTPDETVCRRMALFYGVLPVQMPETANQEEMLHRLDEWVRRHQMAEEGDLVIVAADTRLAGPGSTSALLMHLVGPI